MGTLVVGRSAAVVWLTDPRQAEVRSAVTEPMRRSGQAPPDAVLTRPESLVDALQEASRLAVERGAPPGVAEELAGAARRLSSGMRRPAFDYARTQLNSLVGLRDSAEVSPILDKALESAPDEDSRAILRRMAAAADNMPEFLGPEGWRRVVVTIPDEVGIVDSSGPVTTGETPIDVTDASAGVVDTTGPKTTVLTAPDDVSAVATAGASIGHQIALDLGMDPGAVHAAQAGAQAAIEHAQMGAFGSGASGSGGWCAVGTVIGSLIAGPVGAAIGCGVATAVSHTPVGQAVTHGVGAAQQWLHQHLDGAEAPLEVIIACVLCGETCIICVVTAEGASH